ncbi:hypothetical protein ACTHGU_21580 [Chitinophagaceae bacterium MMS25-I14]
MSSNIDFKALWHKQPADDIPDISILRDKANGFKKKTLNTLVRANISLLATAAFIIYIWYSCQPQWLTTKLGIVLVVFAIVMYLFAANKMIPALKKVNPWLSIKEYLQQLKAIKEQQSFIQRTMLGAYYMLLSAGICLYMLEYTARMQWTGRLIAYGLTLGWTAFGWFYIRPRTVKKQQSAINQLIEKLEEVNKQMEERGNFNETV